jgi:phospholipid N-methyltransferase
MVFLQRFLRHPRRIGAVAPSSMALARQVVAPVPETGHPVVVELGPGTGAFTRAIQDRLGGRGYHLAVELDPLLAGVLRQRFPDLDVAVAAADRLPDLLFERGLPAADVVVSGLPWAALPPGQAPRTLAAIAGSLAASGAFTTFAYVYARWTPPARRLRREIECAFEEVVLGRTVWANLPAALVYHARRPRPGYGWGGTGRNVSSTSPSRCARMPA